MLKQLFHRSTKLRSQDVLLNSLLCFTNHGREEISLPEILESLRLLQEAVPLGYEFTKDFLYSSKLFEDITQLEENGCITRYEYTHDGLLPKSYVTLTMLGRGRAQATFLNTTEDLKNVIGQAVEASIAQYRESWRLYPRI
ncbi:MAG: hypothetical protein HYS38_08405 [Acidobacteria bacterium]|nr:hypothetical protein [Acidobacteriota bacterium]